MDDLQIVEMERVITSASAERVLQAMGPRYQHLDKQKLTAGLQDCLLNYQAHAFMGPIFKKRVRRFENVVSAARRLVRQLEADDIWKPDWEAAYLKTSVEELIKTLLSEIVDLEREIRWGHLIAPSPIEEFGLGQAQ